MKQKDKTRFLALCVLCLGIISNANAAEADVSFVNALPWSSKVDLLYQGQAIRPNAFASGDISAFYRVPPGPFSFELVAPEEERTQLSFDAVEGQRTCAVVYLRSVVKPGTDDILKVPTVLPVVGIGEASFRVAFVGGLKPLSLSFDGRILTLEPNTVSAPLGNGLSCSILPDGQVEPWKIAVEEAGRLLIVVFEADNGKLAYTITEL